MVARTIRTLEESVIIAPDRIRAQVATLRQRAAQCVDLSSDCITDAGRDALLSWAEESRAAAENLELALEHARTLFLEGARSHSLEH